MVLNYHEIVEEDSAYAYSMTCRRLQEHLRFLSGLRAAGSPLVAHLGLTFDDGHASHYRYALPLLQALAFPRAIFFVTSGWMDTAPGYMSWRQVKELSSLGYEIQSHGRSHKFLTACSDQELRQELRASRDTLADRLGMAIEAISLPGGAWDARTLEACAEAGYTRVYNSDPWFGRQERNGVQVIGRLQLRRTMTPAHLRHLLEAEGKMFSLVRAPYQVRRGLRRVLGGRIYHKLWCWLAHDAIREEISRGYHQSQS